MSNLEETQKLVLGALSISEDVDLPTGPPASAASTIWNFWYAIVAGALYGSNKRLRSVSLLLSGEYEYTASALIVARSCFESAADLVYISKNVESNLPKFLSHGLVPTSEKEKLQFQATISSKGIHAFPKSRWLQLSKVCSAIGWNVAYDIFYPYSSATAHAGTSLLVSDFLELTGEPKAVDLSAQILCTALLYHLCIAEIAADLSDGAIDSTALESAKESCKAQMKQLAHLSTPPSA